MFLIKTKQNKIYTHRYIKCVCIYIVCIDVLFFSPHIGGWGGKADLLGLTVTQVAIT